MKDRTKENNVEGLQNQSIRPQIEQRKKQIFHSNPQQNSKKTIKMFQQMLH